MHEEGRYTPLGVRKKDEEASRQLDRERVQVDGWPLAGVGAQKMAERQCEGVGLWQAVGVRQALS